MTIKYIGMEKQTYVRARKKSISIRVIPGDLIDESKHDASTIEALLETGQFEKVKEAKTKKVKELDNGDTEGI